MSEVDQPHDNLFHAVFEKPEHALGLVATLLPAEVMAAIDPGSLKLENVTFVDDALKKLESDLLFRARLGGRDAWLYLLIEHQSQPDRWLPYRLLRYVVRVWQRALAGRKKPRGLPVVVPVVLSQGPRPWRAGRSLAELMAPPREVLATIERYVPRLELLIDDLALVPREAIEARRASVLARLTLLFLKAARDGSDLLELFDQARPLIEELMASPHGVEGLAILVSYTHGVRDIDPRVLGRRLAKVVGPAASEVVMTTAERLFKKGLEKGLEKGLAQGMRSVLLAQLAQRFGRVPARARARVETATKAQLERWATRILSCESIDEVFGRRA